MNNQPNPKSLGRAAACVIITAPLALTAVMVLLLTNDATRGFAMRISRENSVFEFVTAGLFLIGSVFGLGLALKVRKIGRPARVWGFLLLFSFGMFVVGMEEIAWGQKLYAYRTPGALQHLNQQREMTLHNMPGLHGRSDMMWSAFALAGLTGIALRQLPSFKPIAPPPALASWFVIVFVIGMVMSYRDLTGAEGRLFTLVRRMDEFVEMLIAMASCLYLLLCARGLTCEPQ